MASVNTKRKQDAHEDDLYSTPIESLHAIKETISELPEGTIFYDPCDGLGDISDYIEALGYKVFRSDIKNYRDCSNWLGTIDFLTMTRDDIPACVDILVFNPPFTLTEEFVDKAHELGLPLLMFNRLTTLESNSRAKKFKGDWCLERLEVFGYRVSCTKGVDREPTANSVSYAWYFFNPRYGGEPTVGWITKYC
jgi:hypothetical protein